MWTLHLLFQLLLISTVVRRTIPIGHPWRTRSYGSSTSCDCSGSSDGISQIKSSTTTTLQRLRNQYENCTRVLGNLEITFVTRESLDEENADPATALQFLETIEEVTGYVLIFTNDVSRISLPKLHIVWGDTLYYETVKRTVNLTFSNPQDGIGFFVYNNPNLQYIDMRELRSIERGKVFVAHNKYLCYWQQWPESSTSTIDFGQLVGKNNVAVRLWKNFHARELKNFEMCNRNTNLCHPNCTNGHCWGPGADMCQITYRNNCPSSCESEMCSKPGEEPQLCCHKACAAGCYGPRSDQCYECKSFEQDGACVERCNGLQSYNRATGMTEPHIDPKYTYNRDCVKHCPEILLTQGEHCVTQCKDGYHADLENNDRVCRECQGACPKRCQLDEPVTSENIDGLINCTIIQGAITLMKHSMNQWVNFDSPVPHNVRGLTMDDLEKLSTVHVVTDYLEVQMGTESPQSLSFLRNLKTIEGRRLWKSQYAMLISTNDNLRELGLTSLKHVLKGLVYIRKNHALCYADSINWDTIIKKRPEVNGEVMYEITDNKNSQQCLRTKAVCDAKCSSTMGCWGGGDRMCFACANWRIGGQCVDSCPESGYYKVYDARECKPCHVECDICTGEGPRNCTSCKHVSMLYNSSDFECLSECPKTHYKIGSQCQEQEQRQNLMIGAGAAVSVIALLIFFLAAFYFRNKYKREARWNASSISKQGPLRPGHKPNMTRLQLISANELSRSQKQLGSGAFGIVYGGYWLPEGKSDKKVPVAIKLVQEMSGKAQQAILAEAGIMASMHHPHLLRLVGVCLSEGLQLITPLRPLGNLLEFMRKNKQKLGSLDLMHYCHQIASAMEYLERNRLVHRDLAARNVLVKTTFHIEVTDFGLAKMLDHGESEVYVAGMAAVKWLALECLLMRRYTHASDVWAFGVTIWEILTLGQSPYSGIQLTHIQDYLKNGNRLNQPENCSHELYQIMLQCWMEKETARSTFTELTDLFSKMLQKPQIYVLDRKHRSQQRMVPPLNQQEQRRLINDLLQDTDTNFVDPILYFDSMDATDITTSGIISDAPTSPLISSNQQYNVTTDDGNYLVPNAGASSQTYTPTYTPVIGDELEETVMERPDEQYYRNNVEHNEALLLKGINIREYEWGDKRLPVSEAETCL